MENNRREKLIYYFLMKVGNSNCFLSKAKALHGFWVGFSDRADIPKFKEDTDHPIDLSKPDLHFLSLFSSKKWRKKVRVLTFSPNELIIWKIDGDLTHLSKINRPKSEILSVLTDRANFKALPPKKGDNLVKELNDESKYSKSKFLPVTKVKEIPREKLFAPIDSLSVYQYLNRGTFRPIFRCGEDMNFPDFFEKETDNLPSINIRKKIKTRTEPCKLTETAFGKFIRIYLNDLIDFHKGDRNSQDSYFRKLPHNKIYSLIASVLNPAQVETLAYYLSLDLGLIPDVGLGKGLDIADVKASCRHYSEDKSNKIISNAIETLKSLKVNLSIDLKDRILKTKTIRIQCKAYNKSTKNDGILYLKPSINWDEEEPNEKDILNIYTLIKVALKLGGYENSSLNLNNIKSFFDLLYYDLTKNPVGK